MKIKQKNAHLAQIILPAFYILIFVLNHTFQNSAYYIWALIFELFVIKHPLCNYHLRIAVRVAEICRLTCRRFTYLLTYSMVQSPSWEANWFAASQGIPRISPNPKVHYRTHKRPPPVSILGPPNPVHIPTSHLLEIHPNIIYPSTPRSPQWFFPSGFPSKTLYTPLSSPIRATCLAHLVVEGLLRS